MTLQTVLDDISKRPGSGDVIPIVDPATEEPITEFTDCGEEAVNDAVARAKASFESGIFIADFLLVRRRPVGVAVALSTGATDGYRSQVAPAALPAFRA